TEIVAPPHALRHPPIGTSVLAHAPGPQEGAGGQVPHLGGQLVDARAAQPLGPRLLGGGNAADLLERAAIVDALEDRALATPLGEGDDAGDDATVRRARVTQPDGARIERDLSGEERARRE